jgi:hypothetical protein
MRPGNVILLAALVSSIGLLPADVHAQGPSPNAALRYWQAFAVMKDPPADKATADLLESVSAGSAAWDEARLGKILDANSEALEIMQRASTLATCDWGLEYNLGSTAPMAHMLKSRVLGRLNALEGIRLVARGQHQQAVPVLLAGVRFSRHVAEGGPLVSALVAKAILVPQLKELNQIAVDRSSTAEERQQILAAVRALPETGFDWGAAFRREEEGQVLTVDQMSHAENPRNFYRITMGTPMPDRFTVPSQADVARFRATMGRVVEAMRLPPEQARPRLAEIDKERSSLHQFFQLAWVTPLRTNETRVEIQTERQRLLAAVSAPR